MRHEPARQADEMDWDWNDEEPSDLFSENGRPGTETRFKFGLRLLKRVYGLSDDGVCELRRRAAIEVVTGHLKTDGHLGRNFLKGINGDRANAVLSAAGYNFRLVIKWPRAL